MVKSQRVNITDKWIVGGDGTWRDLLVVPPTIKLTLDAIYALFHPREYWTFKKVIFGLIYAIWAALEFPTGEAVLLTITFVIFLVTWTMLYRHIKANLNHIRYRRMQFDEPYVPLDETGDPRSAILLTRHVLVGGDSGSGKSNAVWMILDALVRYKIPFRISVIDPAGGVELNDLQDSPYTTQYVDRPTDADGLIIDFRDRMNERLKRMKRAGIRQFNPRFALDGDDNNWHFLVVDELLLCAAQIKQGVLSPLGDILAVGRKAGFLVVACTQLGQKTTLGDFRDLFPQRIAFSTRTHEMTDAILGSGASQEAPAHYLRKVGEGFLYNEKARGFFQFRTRHITDTKSIAQPKNFLEREAEIISKTKPLPKVNG